MQPPTIAGAPLQDARPNSELFALALATLACAIVAVRSGAPDPAVMGAILLSATISSIAGFAFSAICGAILFHLWADHVAVVQIMITCSIANQTTMVHALRAAVEWRALVPVLAGGLLGLPIGVWTLLHIEHGPFTKALGVFLLGYSLYTLCGQQRTLPWRHPAFDAAAGFIGGVTGGAAALPGAPVTIWCRLKGWDKVRQRALFQPFILIMQVAALLLIGTLDHRGGTGAYLPASSILCVPAGLLGTCVGMGWFRRMSHRQFGVAVNLLLIVSGLSFLL